ncbi:hypothetical protein HD597_000731 [Nonomuraea thailandensis]|uniref:Uncharacterized protein n=1 Tax=Nonomuraea thailandensis TaxID=1188745 RepID=A0A9X2K1M8_9ACTN|nr:hypothetical protein [Nonomuraea thailandensis]
MGEHEQGLPGRVQAPPPAAALGTLGADQFRQPDQGVLGRRNRGRIGQQRGSPVEASDLGRLLSYREPFLVPTHPRADPADQRDQVGKLPCWPALQRWNRLDHPQLPSGCPGKSPSPFSAGARVRICATVSVACRRGTSSPGTGSHRTPSSCTVTATARWAWRHTRVAWTSPSDRPSAGRSAGLWKPASSAPRTRQEQARLPEAGRPRPCPPWRPRQARERPAEELEDPPSSAAVRPRPATWPPASTHPQQRARYPAAPC